jgi:hypothetical protein
MLLARRGVPKVTAVAKETSVPAGLMPMAAMVLAQKHYDGMPHFSRGQMMPRSQLPRLIFLKGQRDTTLATANLNL